MVDDLLDRLLSEALLHLVLVLAEGLLKTGVGHRQASDPLGGNAVGEDQGNGGGRTDAQRQGVVLDQITSELGPSSGLGDLNIPLLELLLVLCRLDRRQLVQVLPGGLADTERLLGRQNRGGGEPGDAQTRQYGRGVLRGDQSALSNEARNNGETHDAKYFLSFSLLYTAMTCPSLI